MKLADHYTMRETTVEPKARALVVFLSKLAQVHQFFESKLNDVEEQIKKQSAIRFGQKRLKMNPISLFQNIVCSYKTLF